MPVEHEIKHVLDHADGKLLGILSERFPSQSIDQFYVTPHNRFRRIVEQSPGQAGSETSLYLHTFKLKVGGRLLEVETEVDEADYRMALQAAQERLVKKRFKLPGDAGDWDVDFLLTAPIDEGGEVYFALAEIEMPEGSAYTIPSELANHVILVVPHEDSDWFTNIKLADQDYARSAIDRYRASRI